MIGTTTAKIQGIRFQTANLHRAEYLPVGTEVRITRKGMHWVARDNEGFFSGRMTWDQVQDAVQI